MPFLRLLNPPNRALRWSIKTAFVLVVALFVLYPNPLLLVRHVDRSLHLSALIEPSAPGIADLAARSAAIAGPYADKSATLRAVELTVIAALPYRYDWQTWGVANYFPTVAETLARGECDCKGRAVVAASVLARLGFTPRLVSDFTHVWVWTAEGEAMSPHKPVSGHRLIDATPTGNRIDWRAIISRGGLLSDIPSGVAFAISVFPPLRTAIIAAAVWLVFLSARPSWVAAPAGAVLIVAGLCVLSASSPERGRPDPGWAWVGLGTVLAGLALASLHARTKKARPPEATGP